MISDFITLFGSYCSGSFIGDLVFPYFGIMFVVSVPAFIRWFWR